MWTSRMSGLPAVWIWTCGSMGGWSTGTLAFSRLAVKSRDYFMYFLGCKVVAKDSEDTKRLS